MHTQQHRRPSTASSVTLTSQSVRRRASSAQHHAHHGYDCESEEEEKIEETVVLRPVRPHPPLPSPPLPVLPRFAGEHNKRTHETRVTRREPSLLREEARDEKRARAQGAVFSPVPLTPRPSAAPAPRTGSFQSTNTSLSRIPPLPTPNFSPLAGGAEVKSFPLLFRGLSFLSMRAHDVSGAEPPAMRSGASEGGSEVAYGIGGGSDGGSASTIAATPGALHEKSGYSMLPSFNATSKLSYKWPAPLLVRRQGTDVSGLGGDGGLPVGTRTPERWTTHKWCLLLSVCTLYGYGGAGLVCAILTWFRAWDRADVMLVAGSDILILITICSCVLLFTALLGTTGAFLNSRPILAVYTLLLWPAFISMLAIGYSGYKRSTFALDRKLNLAWSQWYTPLGRLTIQNSMGCCGFYSAIHDAAPSARCYPRTPLPGCKGSLYRFEAFNLARIWGAVFALVPLHLLNMVVALLCVNHVTVTFGRGIMPRRYRLSQADLVDANARSRSGLSDLSRPELSRAGSSGVFREDREGKRLLEM